MALEHCLKYVFTVQDANPEQSTSTVRATVSTPRHGWPASLFLILAAFEYAVRW